LLRSNLPAMRLASLRAATLRLKDVDLSVWAILFARAPSLVSAMSNESPTLTNPFGRPRNTPVGKSTEDQNHHPDDDLRDLRCPGHNANCIPIHTAGPMTIASQDSAGRCHDAGTNLGLSEIVASARGRLLRSLLLASEHFRRVATAEAPHLPLLSCGASVRNLTQF
jgi:hypothetical protein